MFDSVGIVLECVLSWSQERASCFTESVDQNVSLYRVARAVDDVNIRRHSTLFYVGAVFCAGLIIDWKKVMNYEVVDSNSVNSSPFVIAFRQAGIPWVRFTRLIVPDTELHRTACPWDQCCRTRLRLVCGRCRHLRQQSISVFPCEMRTRSSALCLTPTVPESPQQTLT